MRLNFRLSLSENLFSDASLWKERGSSMTAGEAVNVNVRPFYSLIGGQLN